MRRLVACLTVVLVTLPGAGPAAAVDATATPTPAPTATAPAPDAPAPQPNDGIRELPTEDEGADVYSVVTILLFFVIAIGIFVFIIRAGMRTADRED